MRQLVVASMLAIMASFASAGEFIDNPSPRSFTIREIQMLRSDISDIPFSEPGSISMQAIRKGPFTKKLVSIEETGDLKQAIEKYGSYDRYMRFYLKSVCKSIEKYTKNTDQYQVRFNHPQHLITKRYQCD